MSELTQALAKYAPQAQTEGLWLPMPEESASNYYAFRMWLEAGPQRPKVVSKTSVLFDWERRALAWDEYIHQNPHLEITPEQRHRRNLETIHIQKYIVFSQAVKLMAALEASNAPAVTIDQLAKVTDILVKLERLETDQSTANVSFRGPNLDKLDDEQLAQLDQLAAVAEIEDL